MRCFSSFALSRAAIVFWLFGLLCLLCACLPAAQANPTPYHSAPIAVSATATTRIEAEDYDKGGEGVAYHDTNNGGLTARRTDNIGVYEDANASGGYGVGYAVSGEWAGTTLSVAQAGTYGLTARIAAPQSGGRFHLEFGPVGQAGGAGVLTSAEFTIPYALGWGNYQDVSVPPVTLPAGILWMRVVVDDDYPCNFDFFRLTPVTSLPTATAITFSQSTTANGGSVSGYVNLSGPAPVGGMALTLSSDNTHAHVPATVTLYAGSTTGYFGVTTDLVSATETAHITASGAGNPVSGTLTLVPTVSLIGLSVDTPIVGGDTDSGYLGGVSLNGPAPAGGMTVALSSDNADLHFPATVMIPAGYASIHFLVTASVVTAPETVHMTASTAGISVSAATTIVPVGMDYLGLYPDTVHGGDPVDGYIELNATADADKTFTLSSDSTLVTVPATATVPEGEDGVDFPVTTSAVSTTTQVHITATGPGGPLTALLTLSPLSAPSNLTATATATGPATILVNLNWSGATGATGYAIERSPNFSTWSQIGTASTTTYQDGTAAAGTHYFYRVKVTSGAGSAYSNVAYVSTALPYLVATDLFWLPDPIFAGDHVRFYAVIQNLGTGPSAPSSWNIEFEGDPGETGFNIEANPLAPGDTLLVTSYYGQWWTATPGLHRIDVVVNNSYISLSKTLVVGCYPPDGLTAVSAPGGGINLSWQPDEGATSYNLYRGTSSGGETLYKSGLTGTACQDAALTSGQTYFYKVSGVVGGQESGLSGEASAVPGAGTGAGVISGQDLGFEEPVVGNVWPNFQYDPSGTAWSFFSSSAIAGNASAFTYYNPFASEGVQVGVVEGVGSISQTLTSSAGGAWTVTFSAAQRAEVNPSSQTVSVQLDGVGLGTVTPVGTSYSDYTVGPVTVGAGSHVLSFVGTNPQGGDNTAFIDNVRPMVTAQNTLAAPTNLTATGGTAKITLSWTGVTGATSYNVYRGMTAGGEGTAPFVGSVSGTGYVDSSLPNGMTYYYRVTAVNAGLESPMSNEASATTFSPPAVPTLTATPGYNQVSLSWTSSSGATSYNLRRSTTSGGSYTVISAANSTTSFIDNGVTNGTTVYYVVSAVGTGGESANSNEVSATPMGGISQQPTSTGFRLTDIYLPKTMRFECPPVTDIAGGSHEYEWTNTASLSGVPWHDAAATDDPIWVENCDFQFGVTYSINLKIHSWDGQKDPQPSSRQGEHVVQGKHGLHVGAESWVDVGTIYVTPRQAIAVDNQAVDSRLDPRYSAEHLINHNFTTTTFRGGLFAGYSPDPARSGRSFLRFAPYVPVGEKLWEAGSANAYFAGALVSNLSGWSVGMQAVADNGWTPMNLTWGTAPTLSPSAASNLFTVTYDTTQPSMYWCHWPLTNAISDSVVSQVSLALGLSVKTETSDSQSNSSSWLYFAKKEFNGAEAPCLVYATGAPLSVSSLFLSATTVHGGGSVTGTVTLNGNAPTGGESVAVTVPPTLHVQGLVKVPAGANSVSFTITSQTVSVVTPCSLTAIGASNSSIRNDAILTVTP